MKNLKAKRYDMKATRQGKVVTRGYIDMKATETGVLDFFHNLQVCLFRKLSCLYHIYNNISTGKCFVS